MNLFIVGLCMDCIIGEFGKIQEKYTNLFAYIFNIHTCITATLKGK